MPTLDDVFRLASRGTFDYNIETKSFPDHPEYTPTPDEFAKLVLAKIREYKLEKRVILQSFDWRTLVAMRKLAPEIRLSALTEFDKRDFAAISKDAANAEIVSPEFHLVTPEKVAAAHAAGIAGRAVDGEHARRLGQADRREGRRDHQRRPRRPDRVLEEGARNSVKLSRLVGPRAPPNQPRVMEVGQREDDQDRRATAARPTSTSFVRRVLCRTCMKNSATSSILQHAIASATTTLNGPRSTNATAVVSDRQRRSAPANTSDVSLCAIDVFAHGYFPKCRSIRYSSGNRKIQMMSTKCQ